VKGSKDSELAEAIDALLAADGDVGLPPALDRLLMSPR